MRRALIISVIVAVAIAIGSLMRPALPSGWTPAQVEIMRSLWLGSLPPLPADPGNAVADDSRAAQFGYELFFDARLSVNGEISCAFCHQPERLFTDSLSIAKGVGVAKRHTMSVVGAAYSPWQFWDGRKDSLWSQALGPLVRRRTRMIRGSDRGYAGGDGRARGQLRL